MTYALYGVFDDPYCYKGTACLKNRVGLRDPALLSAFEVEMTALRAEEPLPPVTPSPVNATLLIAAPPAFKGIV